jgi:hypothetical protein
MARVYFNFILLHRKLHQSIRYLLTKLSHLLLESSYSTFQHTLLDGMNGAPKQAEKLGCGSDPASVPATFAV